MQNSFNNEIQDSGDNIMKYTLHNEENTHPEKIISGIETLQKKKFSPEKETSLLLKSHTIQYLSDFIQNMSKHEILLSKKGYKVLKNMCTNLKKTHYKNNEFVIIQFFTELLGPNNTPDMMSKVTGLLQRYNKDFYNEKGHLIDDKIVEILRTREKGVSIPHSNAVYTKVGKARRARVPYRLSSNS